MTAAIDEGVESVICLSTDKAAYPVNAMGTSKAMMEKVIVGKSRTTTKTKICCTRYGNVMCSRGSVIPLWIDQIREGNPITITDGTMTRFIMSLDEAVDLVLFAFEHGTSGDILVQKAPACTIQTQAEAVCELFGGDKEKIRVIGIRHGEKMYETLLTNEECAHAIDMGIQTQAEAVCELFGGDKEKIRVIGIRHGEKMYETLLTNEECAHAIDMGNFYRVPCDKRGLNYDKYFSKGDAERNPLTEFNSNNTELLGVDQVKEKLLTLSYCDKRGLNYDKYFSKGDAERNPLTEFNSNNTELLGVDQVKEKLLTLSYIREQLDSMGIKY